MHDQNGEPALLAQRSHPMPFGAECHPDGGVRFRLYAPHLPSVMLELADPALRLPMQPDGGGWHTLTTGEAGHGARYRYLLPDGSPVPDPASRFQPEDVHGPSEVIDGLAYAWHDVAWKGRPWPEAVLYELHIGTFTQEGSFLHAIPRLQHLRELGVTGIELMCLADFAGNRNWGYDGVQLFAPDSAYGRPEDLKAFIDASHALGLMVILDVVYNHFGPEGNYLHATFPELCSPVHCTPWGQALNFDGPDSREVRELIVHNALYWIEEFHVDGLRLDAAHAMIDAGPRHILDELHDRVDEVARAESRYIHLILENEHNIADRLGRDGAGHPQSYSGQWNHDITHLLGAALSRPCNERQPADGGETERLAKALTEGFVIAAQEGGTPGKVPPTAFIAFLQTHDLVGNRIFGDRVSGGEIAPERLRAMAAIYLLLPQIPMLFMGEEWGASTPFPFFCDYGGELAEAVRKGRCEQLSKQIPAPTDEDLRRAPDPQAEATFRSAELKWGEIAEPGHAALLHLYRELLALRGREIVPLLRGLTETCGSFHVLAPGALAVEWRLAGGMHLHLEANLCDVAGGGFPPPAAQRLWLEGLEGSERQLGPWSVRWSVGS